MSTPESNELPQGKVWASPTKRFFMQMLTRDIDLQDAIFDLLDNCIDGIHRSQKGKHEEFSYQGYHCDLTVEKDKFQIRDNCGGIPLQIAKEYAFKMGRDEKNTLDDGTPTVGMYGIGMKRAIFKMGKSAKIYSKHKDDQFRVSVPNNWAENNDWYFDLDENYAVEDILKSDGTSIEIESLHPDISRMFQDNASFMQNLRNNIKYHYGYIISQGFIIRLNNIPIDEIQINILTSESPSNSIRPYVYKTKVGSVDVEVIIGFYRPPATSEEIENELTGRIAKSSTENAGITIICNDRVVLFRDKTHLTGWGEYPIPNYHTQFINITGVVHFRSKTPIDLPVTTTKRGIDLTSTLYSSVKAKIKDGIKYHTTFTNNWKKPSKARDAIFEGTTQINVLAPGQSQNEHVTLSPKKGEDASYQIPNLPKAPKPKNNNGVKISFRKEMDSLDKLIVHYRLSGKTMDQVGEWCFDEMYSLIP